MLRKLLLRWTPWERAVLDAILAELAPRHREVIQAQVTGINKIQRTLGSREIAFYRMKGTKVDWSDLPGLFDDREIALGRVATTVGGAKITTTVFCVEGHVFSLESGPEISALRGASDFEVQVLDVDKRFR